MTVILWETSGFWRKLLLCYIARFDLKFLRLVLFKDVGRRI